MKALLALRVAAMLRFVRPRRLVAEFAQFAGFTAITVGVNKIAGQGCAYVVGGLLVVLLAFEVDR